MSAAVLWTLISQKTPVFVPPLFDQLSSGEQQASAVPEVWLQWGNEGSNTAFFNDSYENP